MSQLIPQLTVCLENIRSAYNVGSAFRTCESAGVNTLFLTGYTAHPPHPKLDKTALGSTHIPWEHHEDIHILLERLKQEGTRIISLETTPDATSIYDLDFTQDTCLVLGNEVDGVSQTVLDQSDIVAKIPMFGEKESLNIAVAAGISMYEFKRKLLSNNHQ